MNVRQEQIVFGVSIALLGYLFTLSPEGITNMRGGQRSKDFESYPAPDLGRALSNPSSTVAPTRSLLAPPTNTRPLPPLSLDEPPRDVLPGLRPPPVPGPATAHWGTLLRERPQPRYVPSLFVDTAEDAVIQLVQLDQVEEDERTAEEILAGALAGLGYGAQSGDDDVPLTPEEREALLESWFKQYDSIVLASTKRRLWGRIENRDRLGLISNERAEEDVELLQLAPLTGQPVGVRNAFAYVRDSVEEIRFADTPANRVELNFREFERGVTPGNREAVLSFALECIDLRHEAPRALEIAEKLLKDLALFDVGDMRPHLALGRCQEAGFRLDEAWSTYAGMLETWGHHPQPHVRLASLEERLYLYESAEERLREALRVGRGSWEANSSLGSFLLARGREEEALGFLERGVNFAPNDPALTEVRLALRNSYADGLFANGRVAEALALYRSSLQAEPADQRALAGIISCLYARPELGAEVTLPDWLHDPTAEDAPVEGLQPELVLAAGLWSMQQRSWELARDRLIAAAAANPLESARALRALSWVAEWSDHPDEAWRWIEEALEADPTDTWARFQRGRLLAQRDAWESARLSFHTALENELDFEDALLAQGELAFRMGAFDAAERYLERAVGLGAPRSDAYALRGLNLLQLESLEQAQIAFETARETSATDPTALNGLAWCEYRLGDPTEATVQLRRLDDMRRDQPELDPHRVWAREQIERILAHLEKEAWVEEFDRGDNSRLRNDWREDESLGPEIHIADGAAEVLGTFVDSGQARLYREMRPAHFVSFEASVFISDDTRATVGLFVAKERAGRTGAEEALAGVSLRRHRDGPLQYSLVRRNQLDAPTDIPWMSDFDTGRWVRLRIERHGELGDDRVTLSVDGTPVAEDLVMKQLFAGTQDLKLGLFVEGDPGRNCHVRFDRVSIVRKKIQ